MFHTKIFFRSLFSFLSLVVLSASGCGNGTHVISGRVVFPDDAPLTVGTVYFQSPTYVAKGVLDSSGHYRVEVPSGDYVVFITFASEPDPDFIPPPDEPDAVRHVELIDSKYASAEQSPLKWSAEKSQTYDIHVERP